MQILLDAGDEFGGYHGFGLIPGRVVQIPSRASDGSVRKIPHIGWTSIEPPRETNDDRWMGSLLEGTGPGTPFYFVHSFTAAPENPSNVLAVANYAGTNVTAAIRRDNVTGVQFHPEKSGPAGLALIARFLRA
jgi:glutamine amidotransferase